MKLFQSLLLQFNMFVVVVVVVVVVVIVVVVFERV